MQEPLHILIVGAGPTGLACAIEAVSGRLKALVVEKGVLVNSLYHYPTTMTFFTSRERLEIGDLPLASLNTKPHRAEALEYYRRVADFYRLPIHFFERVVGVQGADGNFRVETETTEGQRCLYETRKIILATGYYDLPNLLDIPGEDLPKVSHYYTDPHPYYRRKVAVIGGANSAATAALDLFRHGAEVTLVHREAGLSRHIKYWIRPDLENRIKEGSIRAILEAEVKEIAPGWKYCAWKTTSSSPFPATTRISISSAKSVWESIPKRSAPCVTRKPWRATYPASIWPESSSPGWIRTRFSSKTAASTASKSSPTSRRNSSKLDIRNLTI